jgi:hypothetical protein
MFSIVVVVGILYLSSKAGTIAKIKTYGSKINRWTR